MCTTILHSTSVLEQMCGASTMALVPKPFVVPAVLATATTACLTYSVKKLLKSRAKTSIVVDPINTCPEGLIPGNPLIEGGRLPNGQVAVALEREGKLHIVGGGFRMGDHLITPTHNCQHGYNLWIVANGAEAKVDVNTELILAADVSAFAVPEPTWTQLKVKQTKLGPIKNLSTVTITSSCDNKYSVASLQTAEPLGRVQYHGSTIPGFSGSLYMNGTVAVAMHCHGGHRGGGYELLYLYARLSHALSAPPEDSIDFYLREAATGLDYKWEDLADNQAVLRFADGTYHLTSNEIIRKMNDLRGSDAWASGGR